MTDSIGHIGAGSLVADSVFADSLAQDTVAADTAYAIVLERPAAEPLPQREEPSAGMSWVVGVLVLVAAAVAVRYRNNPKYPEMLLADMYEVRERRNVFDSTARETTFLVMLNALWCLSTGVLLGAAAGSATAIGYAVGAACMTVYTLFMALPYYVVGTVFADIRHAALWERGYTSGQALGATPMLVLALLQIVYPGESEIWLISSAVIWGVLKIVFIWKGFRIFFTRMSSWVLFLYYLCSLEIIPLILTYVAARWVSANLL